MFGERDVWVECIGNSKEMIYGIGEGYSVVFVSVSGENPQAILTYCSKTQMLEYKVGQRYIVHIMPDAQE